MKRAQILTLFLTTAAALLGAGCPKSPKPLTYIDSPKQQPGDVERLSGMKNPPMNGGEQMHPIDRTGPEGGEHSLKPGSLDGPGAEHGDIPIGERPTGTENREVLMGQTIYFDYDKSSIRPNERIKFDAVADYLKNNTNVSLKIEGNCDERGTPEYNRALGERRALAAREYLVQSKQIDAARITTVSFGEDKPADPGHNEAAFTKNRRDDFVVVTPQ